MGMIVPARSRPLHHNGLMTGMRWDVFCRVVDNFGDIGVCWRLAADLAGRGHAVRLWADDLSALAWMAPCGAPGVEAHPWEAASGPVEPGGVVVEAFGCDPPPAFLERMARRATPPAWVNLEYLSAEDYVERSHGLASPRWHGPGAGLVKRFFYPGFTPATGGLLREPGLAAAQAAFAPQDWLARLGHRPRPDERVVSLFCYANPALPTWLDAWTREPTLLLVTPGLAASQVRDWLGRQGLPGPGAAGGTQCVRELRLGWLPLLSQREFDHLLWACDLNLVRGEDSFVRAQWAARPFVWQIYPQDDRAHVAKLDAFLDRYLAGWPGSAGDAQALRRLWQGWNGLAMPQPPLLPAMSDWRRHARAWCDALARQDDLATQLVEFVRRSHQETR